MEILVASTKNQRRWNYESNATTLAELKREFDSMGIDYSGMAITEGISKLRMEYDDSVLPAASRAVNYNGKPYSRVILLTNTEKKIDLGAMPRKEVYQYIKDYNLQNTVLEACGRNYTQVPTADLESIVDEYILSENQQKVSEEKPCGISLPDVKTAPHASTVDWFYGGVKSMFDNGVLQVEDIIVLANLTGELAARLWEETPELDLEDLVSDIC